jgi:hypothetical protein
MKRDTLITFLLVIAGIVLAFVLFWAGARWKGKTSSQHASVAITTAEQVVATNS